MARMADATTIRVSEYIDELGIKVSAVSRATGISDGALRRNLSRRDRSLRVDEFLKICNFLKKEPLDFAKGAGQTIS